MRKGKVDSIATIDIDDQNGAVTFLDVLGWK